MLTQLTINHFAIVDHLIIDFNKGMTAITGETGAGKSISVDALNLCLGARADSSLIRHGHNRIDISAHFLLDDTPSALSWLKVNQLDDQNECIIRRVINQDGRSKAFINGSAIPITQLKEFGQTLIQIHGQHEHQLLMRNDYQQKILDQYLSDEPLLLLMKNAYQNWKKSVEKYRSYEESCQKYQAHAQLLQYQLKELTEFSPIEGEYEQIDEEYKRLSNSENFIHLSQKIIDSLEENSEFNVLNQLYSAKQDVQSLAQFDAKLLNIDKMLDEAMIQIKEANYELKNYLENLEIDPSRIMELELRLSKQIALARKHQISPEELPFLYKKLLKEFDELSNQDERNQELKLQIDKYYQEALSCAKTLHSKRVEYAAILSKKVTESMQDLSMPHGQFSINVVWDEHKITEFGSDQVAYLVTTNPGQPLQPMNKIASGGELSRIALAIQVLTAQKMETPALIFDEIDVGISGPTAAKVGHLLRKLGKSTQVITVTHLPQVAGKAHHHYFVTKKTDGESTFTEMKVLDSEQRLIELARLLGGDRITQNTLANAKELLI